MPLPIDPTPAAPAPEPRRWYGHKILLADAAALTAIAIASQTRFEALGLFGGLGLFVGAPVMHGLEGRPGHAGSSLVLRLGLSLTGLWIGARIYGHRHPVGIDDDMSQLKSGLAGASVGMAAAIAVDALFVARHPASSGRGARDLTLAPTFAVTPGRAVLLGGLGGRF